MHKHGINVGVLDKCAQLQNVYISSLHVIVDVSKFENTLK
jgi:hypothetical protein